ncbi:MAG: AMP-binding protein [Hoeflea sp.]|uniref:AMP-binding protein n=1 Tax=Hoeflea sp. TaxID=1940281 RepID=UPI001D9A1067|nr:AMP-binding protein [Hoeflea sp.]MBU4527215.1 AMP-binding protein [Alphaproteobacteria bacterium]MBU4547002.1 AMP-binding protein [Alphaproteobacteria bacterium]MBU4551486.1 AMP-binding protein [Alphaproteobacteria bacterium]MBV1725491.1 AMP-binding protein [Hoeflea sp.]MBV1759539.1 AMP-binding protein [Hoeflea sp.]
MTVNGRPWTAFYGPSVRADIGAMPFRNLGSLISDTAQVFSDQPAFTACLPNGMNGTLTFRQVDEMSSALAVYLRETAGLNTGDRVALQVPNSLSFPVAAFAVLKAGCVLVNVNPLYTAEEMAKQFADSEPSALIIVDMFADKLPEALKGHHIPTVIVTRVAEFLPAMPKLIVGLVQKYWDKTIHPIDVPHIRLPDAIAAGRSKRDADRISVGSYLADIGPDDIACLQYTGGTTGVSKGAMLSHRNIVMNMAQTMELISGVEKGKEVALTALPMYHIFAFTLNLIGFYWLGAHNILIPNPRPLSNLKRAFENYKITWMSGVNTLFNGLNNEIWFQDSPPRHLKFAAAGGMALQKAVAERWESITGKPVLEGYGLTESSPVLTFNPYGRTRANSIGVPVPSTDLRCLGEDGKPVAPGEAGELAARGPQIMLGYWKKPEETAKVMRDGWLLTGDIATMDADGYFRIVDRKKDMVLVSGFNVYPNEIEDCLATHPGILESAVIGVPDGAAGEAVKAFVIRRDPDLSAEDLRAHCKAHLTAYKVPKIIEFRDELPKSNVGKILRKDLRSDQLGAAEPSKSV